MEVVSKKITVTGLVQGVGFRPNVAELADEYRLQGQVKNLGGMVEIMISGEKQAVEGFFHRLKSIPVGRIDTVKTEDITDRIHQVWEGFQIVQSTDTREKKRFLPVDFSTCDRCMTELFDKSSRRYRYPFISCSQCGPRYSIQKAVPYDRENITMDRFPMCPECEKEYREKGNVRRHAQTIGCPECGPVLSFLSPDGEQTKETERILKQAVLALKTEKIIAVKDIGGFHFAFSPYSSRAAERLRDFKHRDRKPFAVMFSDMEQLKMYCEVSGKEAELLQSAAKPIVLLKKKQDFAPGVCGESDRIGAMLPCNPLQQLLLKETGPLVMTSGNRGGEPIIIEDEEMKQLMKLGCPDGMLTHDRQILTPLDDSIYQVNGEFVQLIRRARGLVPEPVEIKKSLSMDTFAAGGDLKAVFALGRGNLVYLSQHFGDLEEAGCMECRQKAIGRMQELLQIHPVTAVGDLHPAYRSSENTAVKIQHHMAHVASVIAEHGLEGNVLGVAFDGTGYGTDGTIWGSEVFFCGKEERKRVGHLLPVKLLGGDTGAREADKTLFSYLMEAKQRGLPVEKELERVSERLDSRKEAYRMMEAAWQMNINTVYSSSMGRLFDAVSALLDICHVNSYEGECAVLLEQAAHRGKAWLCQNGREAKLSVKPEKREDVWLADGVRLIADLVILKEKYQNIRHMENWQEVLAYDFHHGITEVFAQMAEALKAEYPVHQAAFSGGSFLNRILLPEMAEAFRKMGYQVYTNEKVPCGDGGIALGQIFEMR